VTTTTRRDTHHADIADLGMQAEHLLYFGRVTFSPPDVNISSTRPTG
jgi:hypothetical protein